MAHHLAAHGACLQWANVDTILIKTAAFFFLTAMVKVKEYTSLYLKMDVVG